MLGAVTTIAQQTIGGITFAKSPRYGGGDGPLYSTVNGFADRIATGDLAVIRQLDQLRKTDADKVQWAKFWDEMMPIQPLTAAQVALIKELDPTKSGLVAHGGEVIHAQPGIQPPTLEAVLRGLQHVVTPTEQSGPATPTQQTPMLSNPLATLRVASGLPLWATLLLAGGAGFALYKIVRKR